MNMDLEETLTQLEALGNEKVRARNVKNGAGDNQFGVQLGDIRKLAKKVKSNHGLVLALWETGNIFPDHRERAIAIGETLGIYRDYPVSKGCTSPFAPIWIDEMVRRQG